MLISKLKALTKIILETDTGLLYQLVVIEPEHGIVTIWGGDPAARIEPPRTCKVRGSEVGHTIEPAILQGRRIVFQFADVAALIGPVVSCVIEGAGWHYDLWGRQ